MAEIKFEIKRTLTTDSTAVFIPFVNQELKDRNAVYYGNNAVSRNPIMFNRRLSKSGNGFILGTPGSGKGVTLTEKEIKALYGVLGSVCSENQGE